MEKYRNSCNKSSLNTTYPLSTSRFLNTGPLYTMGSVATNIQQQRQHGPQLLMNTSSVGTATQFQFIPARHHHTTNTIHTPFQFDIGNSIAPILNSVKTFFSNLLKPTIRMDTTYATISGDTATEKRKCNSAPNIYMDIMSDGRSAGDFEKSSFVDTVDYETLSKLTSSTKSFSDYNLPISTVKSSIYCSSNLNIPESTDIVPDMIAKSFEQQLISPHHTTKESNVKISPPASPIAVPLVQPKSISSKNIPTVPNMTRRVDKKRPLKEKGNRKAKRRSGKNQKEKGKHALALNIHEDCVTETETMSMDEWDEPLVIITASSSAATTPPSIQPSTDSVTFSTDDFPAMPAHCPPTNFGTQTLPRLSHCVAALIGKRPQRQLSECDSDDSFIVFDHEDKLTPSSVESNLSICDRIRSRLSVGGRQRQISESSDDDFICFEMEESDTDGDDDYDEYDGEDCDEEPMTSVSDCESEVDVKSSGTNPPDSGFEDKKVRFNLKPVVHVLRTWSFAYQQARKGEWEQYGRDRVRFCDRIKRLESTLGPILNSNHRQKIYCDRFLQTAVNDTSAVGAIDKQ
ncbi:hypothetical protein HA402_014411 [Bradysia odoriphaga]|nr:hypothetical protein HA402_014411 [Bradysia odoriphaga]